MDQTLFKLNEMLETLTNDESIATCERMYNAKFITEPVQLSKIELNDGEMAEVKDLLFIQLASHLYNNVVPMPNIKDEYECEYEAEHEYDILSDWELDAVCWLTSKHREITSVITDDVMVTWECNYKGETEGDLLLADLHANTPVFKSKNDSFYQMCN